MSLIDLFEPRSRNISVSSKFTTRNNTFVKPGTDRKISINPSKARRPTLGTNVTKKITYTLGESMAVDNKPQHQTEIEQQILGDHEVDRDYDLLEHKNKFMTMLLLMLMGMASFTRGYYMMIYNPMGLIWFNRDYGFAFGAEADSWLGLYNIVWMFGAWIGTILGKYLYDKLGPRVCLFIFQGLRIPVTAIYLLPNFSVHVANRAACGVLVGCLIYSVPRYIKQIAPESLCPVALQFANSMAVFGGICVGILGITMGASNMADQWQILLTAPGIIPFIQLPFQIYYNIDSPTWMLDRYATKTTVTADNTKTNKFADEDPDKTRFSGRQLDEDVTFDEKYGFAIDQKHLDKICKDFNKFYKQESADLAFEDLLQLHKEKLIHPQPDFKTYISEGAKNKQTFFVCVLQNVLTRFTGMNHFQFYLWYQFVLSDIFKMGDSTETFGSYALLSICCAALFSLIMFYFIADKINQKATMMSGLIIQGICLMVFAIFSENAEVLKSIYIPLLVVMTIGFSFGMEGSGILFTSQNLPPCAVPHAMYIQWLAGCAICFSNYYMLEFRVLGLMTTLAISCGVSFILLLVSFILLGLNPTDRRESEIISKV